MARGRDPNEPAIPRMSTVMWFRSRTRRAYFSSAVVLTAALAMVTLHHWRAPREVVAGELFRSAQLDVDDLARCVRDEGIRSVLSLRGRSAKDDDYAAEIDWCQANGIVHVSVPLTPTRVPDAETANALLHALDTLPAPVLVHCKEGCDRTGMAVVVYLVTRGLANLDDAIDAEMSVTTGHFSFGQSRAMDAFFQQYRDEARGRSLRSWIEHRRAIVASTHENPPR